MTRPGEPVPVPALVASISADRPVRAVWINELGGVTFEIDGGAEFVKVYPDAYAHLLAAEVPRLRWAGRYTPVPEVLASGPGWLHTARLTGRSAVDPRWADEPETAARAIGQGLRRLHDALPVGDCPFGRPSWVPVDAPPADRLVVCHGDACSPNTLMADDGAFSGHVDLGDLGVADRWADLAIATMSLDWNFPTEGPGGFQELLLEAYGVAADDERIGYYRRAWDAYDDDQDLPAG
ncbi:MULTISPECIES: aminoglycoside 3'-phosphotransferase [unclassified Mycobacterium]|uniref:aminoglycoside 3'-phosphotransferase n=1 Tax=unclassified Mycobacterium TaxID=2642494 RepID=UPI00073FEB94|nr:MULTISPECIES: aminoglycoside 3'-phosphotransferase [unclassified Mycobacterium]KUH85812.1 aminoglycoside phosphotransferase [Mycobacterium sp. GA-1999]KUH91668.1 aminoglycoside phosphotransferase [Mycobacterium sp. GA-0227b]KUH96093.1 aminoglycoside phosphotransferase [Mycobacterium sp. IS-1556]